MHDKGAIEAYTLTDGTIQLRVLIGEENEELHSIFFTVEEAEHVVKSIQNCIDYAKAHTN